MVDIQRGWFYLADLNPQQGTEPGKTRPVLVVQTDLLNSQDHPSTFVIPLTRNIQDNAEPLRVLIPKTHRGFTSDSDLMLDQMRAIDNLRLYRGDSGKLIKKIVQIQPDLLGRVEDCMKKMLDLS